MDQTWKRTSPRTTPVDAIDDIHDISNYDISMPKEETLNEDSNQMLEILKCSIRIQLNPICFPSKCGCCFCHYCGAQRSHIYAHIKSIVWRSQVVTTSSFV